MISFKTQDTSNKYGLVLNTSNPKTQVGLYYNGAFVARKEADESNDHIRDIIDYVDEVMKSLPMKLQQLGYIAAVVGPGSYTGIRIGIAAAQGLALPFKTKLIALSILEALGLQTLRCLDQEDGSADAILISTCLAKNNMVYYQIFDQALKASMLPSVVKHDEIVKIIDDYKTRYHNRKVIIIENTEVNLETLGQLACRNFYKGEYGLTPLYVNQPLYRRHSAV